jgi:hypothetical protein
MQQFSLFLLSATLLCISCNAPAPAPPAALKKPATSSCYALREGKDVTAIELTTDQDAVTGYFAWEPFERDGAHGYFQGKVADGLITADFTYMIEGSIQAEEIMFKMEGDRLLQGRGELEDKNGRLIIKDKSTVEWTMAFQKTDCAEIGQTIQNAKETAKIIQAQ